MDGTAIKEVVAEYWKLASRFQERKSWKSMPEEELWEELCLCMLSSNVSYELAKSATSHLSESGLLEPAWILASGNSEKRIALELSKAAYLPLKRDGSPRRYRFPNIRARNIVNSARALYNDGPGLRALLASAVSEFNLRKDLVDRLSGIGLKEASHFLRNIGYSNSLAIIDTHITKFLGTVLNLPPQSMKDITPSKYVMLERLLKDLCQELGLDLPLFDWAIWHYVRSQ